MARRRRTSTRRRRRSAPRAAATKRRRRRSSTPRSIRGFINQPMLIDGAAVAGGALLSRFVLPRVPIPALTATPGARILTKVGIGLALPFLVRGRMNRLAKMAGIGALADATIDAVQWFQARNAGLSGFDYNSPELTQAELMGLGCGNDMSGFVEPIDVIDSLPMEMAA